MNNAKLWLAVKPTVGLPIFLGAVAVGSFAVHIAVLSKTNWYSDYLVGAPLGTTAAMESNVQTASAPGGTTVFLNQTSGKVTAATIVLPDGRKAEAVFEDPKVRTAKLKN